MRVQIVATYEITADTETDALLIGDSIGAGLPSTPDARIIRIETVSGEQFVIE